MGRRSRLSHYPIGQMELCGLNNQLWYTEGMYGMNPQVASHHLKNTIHVALSTVIIWINPSGVVVVSTQIWLKARNNASLWVLEDANKFQIDMRACVLYNCLNNSSSSLLTSSWEVTPSNGLATRGEGWTTFPLRVTICIFLPSKSSSSTHRINGTDRPWRVVTNGAVGVNSNNT